MQGRLFVDPLSLRNYLTRIVIVSLNPHYISIQIEILEKLVLHFKSE